MRKNTRYESLIHLTFLHKFKLKPKYLNSETFKNKVSFFSKIKFLLWLFLKVVLVVVLAAELQNSPCYEDVTCQQRRTSVLELMIFFLVDVGALTNLKNDFTEKQFLSHFIG